MTTPPTTSDVRVYTPREIADNLTSFDNGVRYTRFVSKADHTRVVEELRRERDELLPRILAFLRDEDGTVGWDDIFGYYANALARDIEKEFGP